MSGRPTRERLLTAARDLVAAGSGRFPSASSVAKRAGVSRLTVYHHFGSVGGLISALAAEATPGPPPPAGGPPVEALRRAVASACEHWASDPPLFRRLPAAAEGPDGEQVRALAAALANADELRPGCSLREAEDVIALVLSFASFDRLHQDGRRSPLAVAGILLRLAAGILNQPPS